MTVARRVVKMKPSAVDAKGTFIGGKHLHAITICVAPVLLKRQVVNPVHLTPNPSWQVYGTTDTTTKEGLFRSAAKAGDTTLITTLKKEPHNCDVQAAGADGLNAMDLAIKMNATEVVNLLIRFNVHAADAVPFATLDRIVVLFPSTATDAKPTPEHVLAYAASILIQMDCDGDGTSDASDASDANAAFTPIVTWPCGVRLKQQWERLDNAETARADWEAMYAISQKYLDGCIEAATPHRYATRRERVAAA